MKIRLGHVSNSSSSSFCIYGCYIRDTGDLRTALQSLGGKVGEACDHWQVREGLEVAFEKNPGLKALGIWHPEGYEGTFIGRPWDSIGDDETGKQFRAYVESALKPLFGENVEFSAFQESWYS